MKKKHGMLSRRIWSPEPLFSAVAVIAETREEKKQIENFKGALDDFGFRALVGFDEEWLASLLRKDRFDVSPVTRGQFQRFVEGLGVTLLIETFLKTQLKIQVSA